MVVKQVDDRTILSLERALKPLARIFAGADFAGQDPRERRSTVVEKIEATKLTAKKAFGRTQRSSCRRRTQSMNHILRTQQAIQMQRTWSAPGRASQHGSLGGFGLRTACR